ncbi:hypothetical protein [Streptomyces lancefieldiae]|uniref:Uncharacterized protein n=1 Tax=Streptomyces lancefieldiae TaxID=3075520 RepID=A0ABU3AVA9_9ACTN|nr:hypothetical protein [Streptomyces sp. DSM 40712]MDT0613760.1 hypothetical protein [Streptomyces sp. DSM 40712]
MTDLIGRLLARLRLTPVPRGAHHRTSPRPAVRTAPPTPSAAGVMPLPALPAHRSPYGLPTTLDGTETVAVRPYLLAGAPGELEAAA